MTWLAGAVALLAGTFVVSSAYAQGGLVTFVEANGCEVRVAASVLPRLQEIAAQGSVTWNGRCRSGRIDGPGVLREQGTVIVNGRTKQYAYHLSGTASNGIRSGRWKRETLERFVDSPNVYTTAATIDFVDGVAKGRPRMLSASRLEQYTPGFRKLVAAARSEAAAYAKSASAASASPATQAGARPAITASSQHEKYGPEGLLDGMQPGWHSANPPIYPEWVVVDFQAPREIRSLGMLPQGGHPERAPREVLIEISDDGKAWKAVAGSTDACAANAPDGWSVIRLPRPASARYFRLSVLSNCGDPTLVTFRWLRLE